MSTRMKWMAMAPLTAAITIALWYAAVAEAPVKDGSALVFWKHACHVDVGPARTELWGGVHPLQNGWFIYYAQGFHGQFLYRVPRAEAVAYFPQVLSKLEAAAPDEVGAYVLAGYRSWRQQGGSPGAPPEDLLSAIRAAYIAQIKEDDEELAAYIAGEERNFTERWRRVQRWWLNVLFEFVYLVGLSLFTAWPWLRRKGAVAWACHTAFAPLLLFLPYYLGYAEYTFTSAGPSGGALYPWLIVWFRPLSWWTSLDTALYGIVPRLLDPLSQPTGPMLSLSGGSFPWTPVVLLGVLLGGAAFALARACRRAGPPSATPRGGMQPDPPKAD